MIPRMVTLVKAATGSVNLQTCIASTERQSMLSKCELAARLGEVG